MNGTEALDGVKCVGTARVNASDFQKGFALLFLSTFQLSPSLPCKAPFALHLLRCLLQTSHPG